MHKVLRLLKSPEAGAQQRADLAAIVERFKGRSARVLAADAIEEIAGLRPGAVRRTRLTPEPVAP